MLVLIGLKSKMEHDHGCVKKAMKAAPWSVALQRVAQRRGYSRPGPAIVMLI